MSETIPACPKCQSSLVYEDGPQFVCPECGHEWSREAAPAAAPEVGKVIRDSVGNVLADGDTVTVVKDLKVKGASSVLKVGTRVRGIRLLPDATDDHDIDCRIEGFGPMRLKSSVVKKA
jgi:protein PhnA